MASSSSASAELSADGSAPMPSATTNLAIQDLKQSLFDAITTASDSRSRAVENQFVTMEQLKELIQTTLDKLIEAKAESTAEDEEEDKETEDDKKKSSDAASSTSEIKIVNEM